MEVLVGFARRTNTSWKWYVWVTRVLGSRVQELRNFSCRTPETRPVSYLIYFNGDEVLCDIFRYRSMSFKVI